MTETIDNTSTIRDRVLLFQFGNGTDTSSGVYGFYYLGLPWGSWQDVDLDLDARVQQHWPNESVMVVHGFVAYASDGLYNGIYLGNPATLAREFVYGGYLDEPVVMDVNEDADGSCVGGADSRYYYHHDKIYNVRGLSDENGDIVAGYEYDPYGRFIVLTDGDSDGVVEFNGSDNRALMTASPLGNPYTFTGQRFDPETGLMYYKNRYYDTARGRFISRDPLGYVDGVNYYVYTNSNPICGVDYLGLFTLETTAFIPKSLGQKISGVSGSWLNQPGSYNPITGSRRYFEVDDSDDGSGNTFRLQATVGFDWRDVTNFKENMIRARSTGSRSIRAKNIGGVLTYIPGTDKDGTANPRVTATIRNIPEECTSILYYRVEGDYPLLPAWMIPDITIEGAIVATQINSSDGEEGMQVVGRVRVNLFPAYRSDLDFELLAFSPPIGSGPGDNLNHSRMHASFAKVYRNNYWE